ncbi:class I SAM-dependent methyltransferase family protein, partial [Candidatus Micrarchaeota archaeon]|nr:class I SAM-dependent methyltransferase family protein [Candidatus Micrarchaeota archaeon]
MLALKVGKESAEKAKQWLRSKAILAPETGAERDSLHVYFPALKKLKAPFHAEWVEKKFTPTRRSKTLREALKGKLSPEQMEKLVSAFDVLGSIAIIEVPAELESKEKTIASALMESHPHVRTVLKKASAMEGEFRIREVKWVAGEKNYVANYRENNCLMVFDVRKTYFSTRLGFERQRVAGKVRPKENVLALFAGAGPYALVIAKKQPSCRVKAVELNPDAFKWMAKNIELNKLKNVEAIQGDVRVVLKKMRRWADRVTMPLPHTGEDFLDSVIGATKTGGVIHFYTFGGDKEGVYKRALGFVRSACKRNKVRFRVLEKRVVRPYAPYVFQVVVDFRIGREKK